MSGETAGPFSSWAAVVVRAASAREAVDIDVPCGSCTACCRSSYFIHIRADETETLRAIPRPLLFPAPGMPPGDMVLGFDAEGRCPMLAENGCSIYGARPRTCRTYDCRVYAAAGLSPEAEGKTDIAARVERWRFEASTMDDRVRLAAVRAAAAFLSDRAEAFPDPRDRPRTVGDLALLAVQIHDLFVQRSADGGAAELVQPDPGAVREAVARITTHRSDTAAPGLPP